MLLGTGQLCFGIAEHTVFCRLQMVQDIEDDCANSVDICVIMWARRVHYAGCKDYDTEKSKVDN